MTQEVSHLWELHAGGARDADELTNLLDKFLYNDHDLSTKMMT